MGARSRDPDAGGTVLRAGLGTWGMLELEHGFRIVDAGATLRPEGAGGQRGRAVAADRLERELRQAGVVRAVVTPPSRSPRAQQGARRDSAVDGDAAVGYLEANNAVARRCIGRPFVPFARLTGPRYPGSRLRGLTRNQPPTHPGPEAIERYAYDDRFHGFALRPGRDGLPDDETLAALGRVGLPVRVVGDRRYPPERATELCGRGFPVVLGGYGGDPGTRDLLVTAIDRLADHDDLHLATGAVRSRPVLERALSEHPDRVLFASGAPETHPNVGVMALLTCSVPEDTMKRAFDDNPSRVVPQLAQ